MPGSGAAPTALEIADAVSAGRLQAEKVVAATLARIDIRDSGLNCFTHVRKAEALTDASDLDTRIAHGEAAGPLAGVPFAVKDLFDVKGRTTTAGSIIRQTAEQAKADAVVVDRLRRAGAILVGTLNMDEFAYGFATENAHYGTTLNPHDTARLAGGSSGGSAAAVAARLVPLTLGSDTNGSIRVPASLCGVFGLRPTHGSLPVSGVFPFVDRLDVTGNFARSVGDLQTSFRVMSGLSATGQSRPGPMAPLKVACLGGWFRANASMEALAGVRAVAGALESDEDVVLPGSQAARSAAFLITAEEGGRRHLEDLRARAVDFDPATRDRLIAGALLTRDIIEQAEDIAARYSADVNRLLSEYDLLIAPSTPTQAPKISAGMIEVDGQPVSARANLGLYTQPLSLAGVPVLSVPLKRPGKLPLGVQLIAAKNREQLLFDAATVLVEKGIVACDAPPMEKGGRDVQHST